MYIIYIYIYTCIKACILVWDRGLQLLSYNAIIIIIIIVHITIIIIIIIIIMKCIHLSLSVYIYIYIYITWRSQEKHTASVLGPLGKLKLAPDFGECTAVCHPPTYLHKVPAIINTHTPFLCMFIIL